MIGTEIHLDPEEERIANKMLSEVFKAHVDPLVFVRALVSDTQECVEWRAKTAVTEHLTDEQFKRMGAFLMNKTGIRLIDIIGAKYRAN